MPPSVVGPQPLAVQVRPRCFCSSHGTSLVERSKRLRAGDHGTPALGPGGASLVATSPALLKITQR
ncbi:unnamed protein product [Urochloa humidicola]